MYLYIYIYTHAHTYVCMYMNICIYIYIYTCMLLLLSHFSCVRLCATPSLGFSRQEHWSGLSFPSPMHESEK